jgi:anti-anti-sigma factor
MESATQEQPFTVTPFVRDGCRVLVLEGELDTLGAPTLEDALDASADGLPVVVDLSALDFIDSSGLYVLLRARDGSRPAALVCGRGSHVANVLDIVKAGQSVPTFDDVEIALKGTSGKLEA